MAVAGKLNAIGQPALKIMNECRGGFRIATAEEPANQQLGVGADRGPSPNVASGGGGGLVQAYNETLKAYENTFGELKIADSDTKPLRNAAQMQGLIEEARGKRVALMESLVSIPSSSEKKPPAKRSRGARKQ
jgi:hypothetical protein